MQLITWTVADTEIKSVKKDQYQNKPRILLEVHCTTSRPNGNLLENIPIYKYM